jgi:hypothetical protein
MATLSLQRSKQTLEADGWAVWIVERWNQWSHKRMDLFNIADLVAIRPDRKGVTGIQATGEDVQEHVRKLMDSPYLKVWLQAENPFFIFAWRKRGERGKRKLWELRQLEFLLKDGVVICQEITAKDQQPS